MLLESVREQVANYGRQMIRRGLTVGTFGNLSIYVPEVKMMCISPSGVDYGQVRSEDVAVLTMDGVQIEGAKKPSTEANLHRIFYQNRPGINAVVHTHSTYATVMACLGQPLDPIHYLIAYAGQAHVPCIPYLPFGSQELAQAAFDAMGDGNAVLLGNHGLVTAGPSLAYAMDAAEQLEFLAELCYRCRLAGGGRELTPDQLQAARDTIITYRKKG